MYPSLTLLLICAAHVAKCLNVNNHDVDASECAIVARNSILGRCKLLDEKIALCHGDFVGVRDCLPAKQCRTCRAQENDGLRSKKLADDAVVAVVPSSGRLISYIF